MALVNGTGTINGYSISPFADLERADLSGADLPGANLYGANLKHTNFYAADLSGADLRGANLYDANLMGANLMGAKLAGANLLNARVDPHHVPLIEAAFRDMTESLKVSAPTGKGISFYGPNGELPPLPVNRNKPGRVFNPGQGTRRGPHGYKY